MGLLMSPPSLPDRARPALVTLGSDGWFFFSHAILVCFCLIPSYASNLAYLALSTHSPFAAHNALASHAVFVHACVCVTTFTTTLFSRLTRCFVPFSQLRAASSHPCAPVTLWLLAIVMPNPATIVQPWTRGLTAKECALPQATTPRRIRPCWTPRGTRATQMPGTSARARHGCLARAPHERAQQSSARRSADR